MLKLKPSPIYYDLLSSQTDMQLSELIQPLPIQSWHWFCFCGNGLVNTNLAVPMLR